MRRPFFLHMNMTIEYVPIDSIKPYKGNAKKHPRKQINQIIESIREFGFNDPVGVRGGVIVEGHGRYLALKEMGWTEIPVIRLDHLTDEQMKAYVLIHNQLTMNTGFDLKTLKDELMAIPEIDMKQFGFDLNDSKFNFEEAHERYREETRHQAFNIENTDKAQYPGVGKYDIPEIAPVYELPEIKEWIGFNYVLSDDHPEGKAVHFFLDDYQFERIWNNPDKYIDKLKRYVCVASPDFSPYDDMPFALKIYNHYRKHWVGRYLQEHGVTVIPTIRGGGEEKDRWTFDGEPMGSYIIVSMMWSHLYTKEENEEYFDDIRETLQPKHIFVYGKEIPGFDYGENVTLVKGFTEKRWG